MQVKIESSKSDEMIQLGDVFVNDDKEQTYILLQTYGGEDRYCLASLGGSHWWSSYKTFDEALLEIRNHVQIKKLTHYPKGDYVFTLSRK